MNIPSAGGGPVYFQPLPTADESGQPNRRNRADMLRQYSGDGSRVTESSFNPDRVTVRATSETERLTVQAANRGDNLRNDSSEKMGLNVDIYA